MGPMSSTRADGVDRRSRDLLEGLLDLYERERSMYGEVLTLTRRQLESVRRGDDLADVRDILDRKRRMLDMIAGMEQGHAQARSVWDEVRGTLDGDLPRRMRACLKSLGELIGEILELEAETDRVFFARAEGA